MDIDKTKYAWIKRYVQYWAIYGILSNEELQRAEEVLKILKELRDKGIVCSPEIDELIRLCEEAIECRYSYLEEHASLGNNWW